MAAESEARSLKCRLAEAEGNLQLIRERMSEFVEPTEIPLRFIKEKRRLEQEIEELRTQLARVEAVMQVKAEVRLNIRDPLSLVQPGSQGPVQVLLEKASNAWAHANRDEVLHFCRAAMRCAERTNDVPGAALARLYLAGTYARIGRSADGVNPATSAARVFEMRGCSHNAMVAYLLLAHLECSLQNLDEARLHYQKALTICQKLRSEEKRAARHEVALYEQFAVEIQNVMTGIATAIAKQFDQICRLLGSIPILRLSDAPSLAIFERSNVVGYVATGEFLVEGRTYYLHPLGEAPGNRLELKAGAVHFALPVPEDGWLDPASKKGDYTLVRRETQITQEGLGVLWTGKNWVGGRFERDVTTGDVHFVSPRSHIIGKEQGYAIALLKPVA